jgi:hypothetical protein
MSIQAYNRLFRVIEYFVILVLFFAIPITLFWGILLELYNGNTLRGK